MKKRIFTFSTLEDLVQFSKLLPGGYVLNTINLTVTITVSDAQHFQVPEHQPAGVICGAETHISTAV